MNIPSGECNGIGDLEHAVMNKIVKILAYPHSCNEDAMIALNLCLSIED